MFSFDFQNKPSFVSINCKIRDAIKNGNDWIELNWGENRILIEKHGSQWIGQGWIGKSCGYDIAEKLNRNK